MPPWAHQPDRGISGHTLHVIFFGPDAVRLRPRHLAPRRGWELAVKLKGRPLALRHLFENEDAIRAGHQPPHRILLIGTGGGMCCIRMAAYLTAWRDAGLARAVDHAITVSGSGGAV